MNNRSIVLGALALCVFVGCGDDDKGSHGDAGPDAGAIAGSGGRSTAGHGAGAGGASGAASGGGSHAVHGKVTGLTGSGLVLQDNGGDDLEIKADGDFVFATMLDSGAAYDVKVSTQPSDPAQTCSVDHGSGTIDSSDITDVAVTCVIGAYKIGGTATLNGAKPVLVNNGGDDLTLSATGTFAFAKTLGSGAAYAVTVKTQPAGFTCAVSDGSGKVGNGDVTNIALVCAPDITLQVVPGFGDAAASWNTTGGATYDLYLSSDTNCDLTKIAMCHDGVKQTNVKSPYTASGLTNNKAYYFRVKASYDGGLSVTSNQTGARPTVPSFDGSVNALAAAADGTVYAGGSFQRLLQSTGAAVPLNIKTALASDLPNFPNIDGEVYAVISDGSGGFYVGGGFGRVDDAAYNNLIHIKKDGTVDSAWNPGPNNQVRALVLSGTTLYAAGLFTTIGTQPRVGLAALDATGAVTGWNPMLDSGPIAIAILNGNLIAGGGFTTVGGQPHARLVALDLTSGAPSTTWNPAAPDDEVDALAVSGTTLYVGGAFNNIAGMVRHKLASLDGPMATLTSWDPYPDNTISALTVSADGNTIYVAGAFANIASASRTRLAALDKTGSASSWDPAPDGAVLTMALSGTNVFAGGLFKNIGGKPRNGVAQIGSDGKATDWDPNPNDATDTVVVSGDTIYIGGLFGGVGGVARSRLVAFDKTGKLTAWDPKPNDVVNALAVLDTTVYAGGNFTMLGTTARNRIAALDAAGAPTAWNPNADGNVQALVASGTTIYAGGDFSNIGGSARSHIAAIAAAASGMATSWNANADNTVSALAVNGTAVYAGGTFANIGGAARSRIAALDLTTGTANAMWNPNADAAVAAITLATDGTVYAGGSFANIGAAARSHMAGLDATTGAATSFDPNPDAQVLALGYSGARLYMAGDFVTVGPTGTPTSRDHLAAFDDTLALVPTWLPNADDRVQALAFSGDAVYAGGTFSHVEGRYADHFASLMKSP
jgi:hypothetical protein